MITRMISIPNMTESDKDTVSRVLHDVWGVRNIQMNTEKKTVAISFDENAATLEDFRQAMIDNGFECQVMEHQPPDIPDHIQ
ncbi:heavy-metal-associated domain-containing protein [Bacillus smithii]|uniref:heavy-metal-associated domain-containing protein n=1 Tax=Bacillus smithii TaxID=1479 RepID=UPI003D1F7193